MLIRKGTTHLALETEKLSSRFDGERERKGHVSAPSKRIAA